MSNPSKIIPKMIQINLIIILITAIIAEIITLTARYYLKLKAKKIIKKGAKSFGFRRMLHMHHLFIGIIIALVSYAFGNSLFFNIGLGISLSDLIHHFLILELVEDDNEFNIMENNGKRKISKIKKR